MTGRHITGAEALRMGLVTSVVSDDGLDVAIDQLTDNLRRLPPEALWMNKLGINRACETMGM